MKKKTPETTYYFVDESGDPTFFDRYKRCIVGKQGCSPILLLGMLKTTNPIPLRQALLDLQSTIVHDDFYKGIPSLYKTQDAFHAKDDIPEIRERVFRLLATLEFKAEFIVARKVLNIFTTRHKARGDIFYDNLITKLFENKLHLHENNIIYFATRGNKTRQQPLEEAIQKAKGTFETKWNTKIDTKIDIIAQQPKGEPCLQIIDYMNWAVYRAYTKREDRFIRFLRDKVSFLLDIYDFDTYPHNYYSQKNPFDIKKISPL
jgi:hypothetical protein